MTVSFSVIFPNKKLTKKRSLSLSFTFLASFLATRAFLPLLGFFDPLLSFLRDSFSLSFSQPKVAFFFHSRCVEDSTKWVFSAILFACVCGGGLFLGVDGLLMSLAIVKDMGFDDKVKDNEGAGDDDVSRVDAGKTGADHEESADEGGGTLSRYRSESSIAATEDEEEDEERKIELGPQCTLKEQLEKDKDDESLRRWKEQLLGSVDINSVGESLEPSVKILSLAIKAADRPDIVLAIPEGGNPKGLWFTLKEGSRYSLMFTFQVENNIVSGLKYTNTVWKTGMKVDSTKEMIGTFSPQAEPYTHEMPEETTPSGMFARGAYSARSKFVDDDNKCYLEINYTFDIRKEWQ